MQPCTIETEKKHIWKIDCTVPCHIGMCFFSPFNWKIYLESRDHSLWNNTSSKKSQSITSKLNESHKSAFLWILCVFFSFNFIFEKNTTAKLYEIGERNHPSTETSISPFECCVCTAFFFIWSRLHSAINMNQHEIVGILTQKSNQVNH